MYWNVCIKLETGLENTYIAEGVNKNSAIRNALQLAKIQDDSCVDSVLARKID